MVLGWERINARRSAPNKNIVFIKPRPGPDESIAKDYLERIAAQCLPIMTKNHLGVVSLEEYEPNLEFWGRNFNNGEVIQLVLKSPSTGHWLPFHFVQMVMMHELAHCKEMNHSKAFWKVRNEFSDEMKHLWQRGYTGEGLWGKGVLLENGAFARQELEENEVLPEHMCGGTFKSQARSKKRKAAPKITYKEAKERRIRKKFGENGVTLGADDEVKAKLEKGKRAPGKPSVAGSARGRELRAAAALARFEVKKEEPAGDSLITDSEAESESDDGVVVKHEPDDAVDIDGSRLLDIKGRGMVKVCEDGDKEDEDMKRELLELQGIQGHEKRTPANMSSASKLVIRPPMSLDQPKTRVPSKPVPMKSVQQPAKTDTALMTPSKGNEELAELSPSRETASRDSSGGCPVCSVENDLVALTCLVCSNVLKPDFVIGSWTCKVTSCREGYVNAGDVGICGICGSRKDP